jgi:DNA repair protein RecO (recombination protein O)
VNQKQTTGIVLSRTDYGEADRIVTLLTPHNGKLRLMARGVRKIKSKLAGGIELFSVSDITYIEGRKEIGTLISARLKTHYGRITTDIDRVQQGYELIKLLNKSTEDEPEAEYFDLLKTVLESLDDPDVGLEIIRAWFDAQLLKQAGHSPNLSTDTAGNKLAADQTYTFDLDSMSFALAPKGRFKAEHIKTLRLLFSGYTPRDVAQVQGIDGCIGLAAQVLQVMHSAIFGQR